MLLPPFRHLYSLFISNQLRVANAWSIQQFLRAKKRPRFFLSSSQSFRDLSRALLLEPREYQSWEETGSCLLSLLSLVVPRNLGRREESWGNNREATLFGIIRRREQFFFPRIQRIGDGTMVRKMALRSSTILTNKGKNRSNGLFSNRWRYSANFSSVAFQFLLSINIREKNEEYVCNSNCKWAFV